jgi:6-phosphogluconolactonase
VDPATKISWSLWNCRWVPPASGQYTVAVRATDGTGALQISEDRGTIPQGSTGASENSILVYSRNSNGLLTFRGPVSTHGRGSGGMLDPLQSQGSLVLSQDGSFLFAANPGSGTITTFRVVPSGLAFIGEADSGGAEPISIAIHGDLLYVLNTASITGSPFWETEGSVRFHRPLGF